MENHRGAYRIIGTTKCMNGESLGANRTIGYYRMYEWRIIGVLTESLGTKECMNGESLGANRITGYYRM